MCFSFFFTDPATTETYTLSLHDALPISAIMKSTLASGRPVASARPSMGVYRGSWASSWAPASRSEEHTSELQSHVNLVCRLLLEKKKLDRREKLRVQRLRPPLHPAAREQ